MSNKLENILEKQVIADSDDHVENSAEEDSDTSEVIYNFLNDSSMNNLIKRIFQDFNTAKEEPNFDSKINDAIISLQENPNISNEIQEMLKFYKETIQWFSIHFGHPDSESDPQRTIDRWKEKKAFFEEKVNHLNKSVIQSEMPAEFKVEILEDINVLSESLAKKKVVSESKKPKIKLDRNHHGYVEVDRDGGISFGLLDSGPGHGLHFELSSQYCGSPCLSTSIELNDFSVSFLDELQKFIDKAREDAKGIDWEARYEDESWDK